MLIKNRIALILALLILLCGCEKMTVNHKFNKEEIKQDCPDPSEIGRYQIILGSITVKSDRLLDTKTGRVWECLRINDREGEPRYWSEMYIESNPNSLGYLFFNKIYPPKNKPKLTPEKPPLQQKQ